MLKNIVNTGVSGLDSTKYRRVVLWCDNNNHDLYCLLLVIPATTPRYPRLKGGR